VTPPSPQFRPSVSQAISVAAAQGVVTLRGVVPTFTMLAEIERGVVDTGITRIDNQLPAA
jgi:hypothetical protein